MSAQTGAIETATAALCAHGPTLLLGSTVVLAGGLLVARAQRTPTARRRLGIWTALASAVYLALAIVPLPRLEFGHAIEARTLVGKRAADVDALSFAPTPRQPATVALRVASSATSQPAKEPPLDERVGSPPAATQPTEVVTVAWDHVFATIWLAAAALLCARHIAGMFHLARLLRRASVAPPSVAALADLPAAARVLIADRSVRPFCAGWLRPVIVVSQEHLAQPGILAAVLRHEAAHLSARDPLVRRGLALLTVPFALHPLFWWLAAFVRFQSELCADECAAGNAPTRYARDLLDLVDQGVDQGVAASAAGSTSVAIFHRRSDFYRRIQVLLQPKTAPLRSLSRFRRSLQLGCMLALVGVAAGTFGVPARAQDADAQRAALQQEITVLRKQIEQLRAQLAAANREHPPTEPSAVPTPPAAPAPAPTTGASEAREPRTRGVPVVEEVPPLKQSSQTSIPPDEATPAATSGTTDPEVIVALTSRLLDIEMEINIARSDIEESKVLAETGVVSQAKLRRATAELENLVRKRKIVRSVVDGEIRATASEIAWLSRSMRSADKNERLRYEIELMRANGRLEALRSAR